MGAYILRRILLMIPTLIAISLIIFTIIQMPPGNYLESYIAELQSQGESVDPQKIAFLREHGGLDKPLWQQYLLWVKGMLVGDFGYSFQHELPVSAVIGDRLWFTIAVTFATSVRSVPCTHHTSASVNMTLRPGLITTAMHSRCWPCAARSRLITTPSGKFRLAHKACCLSKGIAVCRTYNTLPPLPRTV